MKTERIPGVWTAELTHHGTKHPTMDLWYFCVDAASGFGSNHGHVTREQFAWLCERFGVANPLAESVGPFRSPEEDAGEEWASYTRGESDGR